MAKPEDAAGVIAKKYNLNKGQAELFFKVHNKHMKFMNEDSQKKYALQNIKDIKWDKQEQTVNVYYDDNWWHYNNQGKWY